MEAINVEPNMIIFFQYASTYFSVVSSSKLQQDIQKIKITNDCPTNPAF